MFRCLNEVLQISAHIKGKVESRRFCKSRRSLFLCVVLNSEFFLEILVNFHHGNSLTFFHPFFDIFMHESIFQHFFTPGNKNFRILKNFLIYLPITKFQRQITKRNCLFIFPSTHFGKCVLFHV